MEELIHSRMETGNNNLRRNLVQWYENEGAVCQARVRNLKVRSTKLKVSHHQDIQVEGTRAVGNTGGPVPAEFLLNLEESLEEGTGGKGRVKFDHGVEKAGLIGESYGLGGIERGAADHSAEGGEPGPRRR